MVNDAGNNIYLDNFKVEGNCEIPTGIKKQNKTEEFKLYPNPAMDILNIELGKTENGNIEIIDLMGRIISKESISNTNFKQMNVSGLSKGIYFIRLQLSQGTSVKSFIHP